MVCVGDAAIPLQLCPAGGAACTWLLESSAHSGTEIQGTSDGSLQPAGQLQLLACGVCADGRSTAAGGSALSAAGFVSFI